MKIQLNELVHNTAVRNFTIHNKEALQNGKISGKIKKLMIRQHEKAIYEEICKNKTLRIFCLDICKYGTERAFRLHLLRRQFTI